MQIILKYLIKDTVINTIIVDTVIINNRFLHIIFQPRQRRGQTDRFVGLARLLFICNMSSKSFKGRDNKISDFIYIRKYKIKFNLTSCNL